jgi:4-hydroxy-2-oxoheptanedioate aldolase
VRYPLPGGRGGQRGSAFSTRAAGFGAFGGPAHTKLSNDGLALVVMIETPEAAQQARAIAAVDGVDAVFVGPNDLAHVMGHENRIHDPEVQAVIEHVMREVAAAGKCPGVLALSAQDQARYTTWGARLFATVTTGIITQALRQAAQAGDAGTKY